MITVQEACAGTANVNAKDERSAVAIHRHAMDMDMDMDMFYTVTEYRCARRPTRRKSGTAEEIARDAAPRGTNAMGSSTGNTECAIATCCSASTQ